MAPNLSRTTLLSRIMEEAGPVAEEAARKLFHLASEIGAVEVPGTTSISFRLQAPQMEYSGEITLFGISQAAPFYLNWLERWEDAGAPGELANEYLIELRRLLGVKGLKFSPTQYKKAVPLQLVGQHFDQVRTVIKSTVERLRQYTRR